MRYGVISAAIAAVITMGTLLLVVFVRSGRLSLSDAVVAGRRGRRRCRRDRAGSGEGAVGQYGLAVRGCPVPQGFTDFVAVEQGRTGAQRTWPRPRRRSSDSSPTGSAPPSRAGPS